MKAIDKIQLLGTGELLSFEVPEWSKDEDLFIIYHRPFTLADVSHIEKHSDKSNAKTLAHTVVLKCLDAEGNKIFSLADIPKLMRTVKSQAVINIVNKLNSNEDTVDYPE